MQLRHHARRRSNLIKSGQTPGLVRAHLVAPPDLASAPILLPSIQTLVVHPTRFARVFGHLGLRNDMSRLHS